METTYLDVLAFAVGCKVTRCNGVIDIEPIEPTDARNRSAAADVPSSSSDNTALLGEMRPESAESEDLTETRHVDDAQKEPSNGEPFDGSETTHMLSDSARTVRSVVHTHAASPEQETPTEQLSGNQAEAKPEGAVAQGRSLGTLIKRMSTIKGDISRRLNAETVEEEARELSDDIEAVQDETKLYVTLPFKATVLLSALEKCVGNIGGAWSELHVDMQKSILKGNVFDGSKLTTINTCKFTFRDGILAAESMLRVKGNSSLENIELRCSQQSFSFEDCVCSINESYFDGFGLVVSKSSKLRMVGCEVCKSAAMGMSIESGCTVTATECKFVENAIQGVAVWAGGKVTLTDCDVIGGGIRVEGQGACAALRDSNVISSKKANILACEGATVSMTDIVSYDSQGHGLEAHGKGTSVKMKGCEILNSEAHCVSINRAAHLNMSNCVCKGSSDGVGLQVMNRGSKATVLDSEFVGNCAGGVLLGKTAWCMLQGCKMTGSLEGFGITAMDDATELVALKCTVSDNQSSGIVLKDGAYGTLKECVVAKSVEGYALEAIGKGSRAFDTGCKFQGDGVYSSEDSQVIRNNR